MKYFSNPSAYSRKTLHLHYISDLCIPDLESVVPKGRIIAVGPFSTDEQARIYILTCYFSEDEVGEPFHRSPPLIYPTYRSASSCGTSFPRRLQCHISMPPGDMPRYDRIGGAAIPPRALKVLTPQRYLLRVEGCDDARVTRQGSEITVQILAYDAVQGPEGTNLGEVSIGRTVLIDRLSGGVDLLPGVHHFGRRDGLL